MENPKEYSGFERKQVFVTMYHKNPLFQPDQSLPAWDKRMWVKTPEWRFCLRKHRKHWRSQGVVNRTVPNGYRDADRNDERGWFFPEEWLREFSDTQRLWREPEAWLRDTQEQVA